MGFVVWGVVTEQIVINLRWCFLSPSINHAVDKQLTLCGLFCTATLEQPTYKKTSWAKPQQFPPAGQEATAAAGDTLTSSVLDLHQPSSYMTEPHYLQKTVSVSSINPFVPPFRTQPVSSLPHLLFFNKWHKTSHIKQCLSCSHRAKQGHPEIWSVTV